MTPRPRHLLAAVVLFAASCSSPAPDATPTPTPPNASATAPSVAASAIPSSQPAHRIQVRTVEGNGEFYDAVTGERFVPRGMNYNRFLPSVSGSIHDNVLSTRFYDPAIVDADFGAIAELGFNVVRVMLETCGSHADGCIPGPDGRINPAYMDNGVDLLERARAHGLYVMVASNTLPDEGYWLRETARLTDATFDSANNEFLNPRAVPLYADYWRSLVQSLVDRAAPFDAIWGYELRQEHHFHLDQPPLSLLTGQVTTANGRSYDMTSQADKDRMIDEGLVYWADLLRTEIRSLDPTALVTVGFFTPNAPHEVNGPDETRLVRTAYFMRNSTMDFIDLHHYPGDGVGDAQIWENFGIEGVTEKPLVLGEFGGVRHWWSDAASAAAAVMALEVDSCRVGFDGWLVWAWRGDDSVDLWWAAEGDAEIATVTAPVNRPDPCAYGDFDFIRYNAALDAVASASSSEPSNPASFINDQTSAHWNAADGAPQWVELALARPTDVEQFRLVIAQSPAGRSVHELWARRSEGVLERLHVFDGVTDEGDVLVFTPPTVLTNVDLVRVVTTSIGDLAPAWHEIEVLTDRPPD